MISEESARAFRMAIPSSWTIEPRENDYGVDFDVEIFQNGHTTGLHFGVQLKSTHKARRRGTVRVKQSTANYWSSLDYPILVVLYESVGGALWWQWWHRYDPHGSDISAARFTLPFPQGQVWDKETTPSEIETEVVAYRCWANAEEHLPLSVVIRGEGEVAGLGTGAIIASLRRRLREFEDLFLVRTSPLGPLFLTIHVGPNESVIWVSGGGSATLHYESLKAADVAGNEVAQRLSADILLLVADRIAVLGLKNQASSVVSRAMRESSAIFDPDIAYKALIILLEGGPVATAMDLMQALIQQGSDDVATTAMWITMSWARMATREARHEVIEALLRLPADLDQPDHDLQAGRFTYNAAQLASRDDFNEAISLMLRASELDPTYLDRAYWWREKGGLLFLLGRHEEAAADYREAVARGDTRAQALLADALLWSREVDEAVRMFDEVVKDPSTSTPEWRLKGGVFRDLQKYQQAEHRLTNLLDAALLHELSLDGSTTDEVKTTLAIGAALLAEGNPVLWLQAMGACAQGDARFDDVALTARRFCGEDMVDLILEQEAGAEAAQGLLELFEQLPPAPEAPNVIRFINPETGELSELKLNEPSSPD